MDSPFLYLILERSDLSFGRVPVVVKELRNILCNCGQEEMLPALSAANQDIAFPGNVAGKALQNSSSLSVSRLIATLNYSTWSLADVFPS